MVKLDNGGVYCRFVYGWTKKGIDFLYKNGDAIYADDFAGYTFVPSPKLKIGVAVSTMGVYFLYSLDPKKPDVTVKQESKIRRWLLWRGFIRYTNNDPFPEFEPYNNIKIDVDGMRRIDGNFFSSVTIEEEDGSRREIITHREEEENGTESPA